MSLPEIGCMSSIVHDNDAEKIDLERVGVTSLRIQQEQHSIDYNSLSLNHIPEDQKQAVRCNLIGGQSDSDVDSPNKGRQVASKTLIGGTAGKRSVRRRRCRGDREADEAHNKAQKHVKALELTKSKALIVDLEAEVRELREQLLSANSERIHIQEKSEAEVRVLREQILYDTVDRIRIQEEAEAEVRVLREQILSATVNMDRVQGDADKRFAAELEFRRRCAAKNNGLTESISTLRKEKLLVEESMAVSEQKVRNIGVILTSLSGQINGSFVNQESVNNASSSTSGSANITFSPASFFRSLSGGQQASDKPRVPVVKAFFCVACQDYTADCALMHCGHVCLCRVHAQTMSDLSQLDVCPVCKAVCKGFIPFRVEKAD